MFKKKPDEKYIIGRAEWCALPDLSVPAIKAKIDTGAKTSAIHAFDIKLIKSNDKQYVEYKVYPIQANSSIVIKCKSLIIDERFIMSSNGHKERRYVINTALRLADSTWSVELTLSNRDPLRFRLLLGREALNHKVIIDPSLNCHQKNLKNHQIISLYK